MKSLIYLAVLMSFAAQAKDVKDFNKVLISDVQRSIHTDNDQVLKSKQAPMRGPASVEEAKYVPEEVFEKRNVRQTGLEKW